MSHTGKSAGRALFFGRPGCRHSELAVEYLELLDFDVRAYFPKSRQETFPGEFSSWNGDYVFSFRNYYRIPAFLLANTSVAAINFHPGSAEYPGSGGINWALYENASHYGVTAHLMTQTIDSGPIIECRRFPILPQDSLATLLARTHMKTYELFVDITTGLALEGRQFLESRLAASAGEKWAGKPRLIREIDDLQTIQPGCSKAELERIIRATYLPEFPPEIRLHGYRFALKL